MQFGGAATPVDDDVTLRRRRRSDSARRVGGRARTCRIRPKRPALTIITLVTAYQIVVPRHVASLVVPREQTPSSLRN